MDEPTHPQARRTRSLMLDAAYRLLAEHGPAAVTHLRIAEEAGVSRATVYRHWPDRGSILLDLLRRGTELRVTPPPPDADLLTRVTLLLRSFAAALSGEGGRVLAAMVGLAEWDEDVAAALRQMAGIGPGMLADLLGRGVAGGELDPSVDVSLLVDRLIGPLYLRRLLYREPIDDERVERLVAATLVPLLGTR
ncbi:MAG TPA: TetR/AcrR family transcriptional regulator [Actinobacteria bacterium]|nr:TetR/AcrR family transcriptional regulator [Actinomycetota bacterium]